MKVRIHKPSKLQSLQLVQPPNRINYGYSDRFDPTGMIVKGIYSDGSEQEFDDFAWMGEFPVVFNKTSFDLIAYDDNRRIATSVPCNYGAPNSIFAWGDDLASTDTCYALKNGTQYPGVWHTMITPNPASHWLPSGYTELDKIISTGSSYLDTQVLINSNTIEHLKYVLDARPTMTAVGNRWWANGIGGGSTVTYHVGIGSGGSSTYPFTYGNGYGDTVTNVYGSIGTRYRWEYDTKNKTYKVYEVENNDNLVCNITSTAFRSPTSNSTVCLCCWRYYGGSIGASFSEEVYHCQFYEDDRLIRNMYPAIENSTQRVGMYDMVNDKFYYSFSSTPFTAGTVIPQYIDNSGFYIENLDYFGPWEVHAIKGESEAITTTNIDGTGFAYAEMIYGGE